MSDGIQSGMSEPATPAGWYPHPDGGKRWWDGTKWTEASKTKVAGLSIAALSVGGLAFLLGLVPGAGIVLGLAGLALGIVALVLRKQPRWMVLVGTIGSGLSLLTAVIVIAAIAAGGGGAPTLAPISEAPGPTVIPTPVSVEVPDLGGMSVDAARSELRKAGFEVEAHGASGSWIVSAQEPAAGTIVDPGSVVSLQAEPDLSPYSQLDDRSYSLIAKDPEAHVGEKVIVYGNIVQFDSFTGPCGFRANTGPAPTEYSYEYEVNTLVVAPDEDECPVLDDFVQDDHIKVWATILGAYEYDTTIGGTATAVLLEVESIQLLDPQEF